MMGAMEMFHIMRHISQVDVTMAAIERRGAVAKSVAHVVGRPG